MRRTTIRTTMFAAIAAGALLAVAPAAAQAAPAASCHRVHQQSGPNYGLLNGTNLYLPVDLGLNFTDNALGLLGGATTNHSGGDTASCGN